MPDDAPSAGTPAPSRPFARARGLSHVDGWANVLTGLGLANRDKRLGAVFQRDFEIDRNTLENLYHGDDVIARVCELPAKEALREWIEILSDTDRKVSKKLDALNARKKLYEALVWARLYGGSVVVMVVDDGQTLDTPLDPAKVKDVIDLMVIDRWDLWITRFYDDPKQPDFGQPMLYSIRTSAIVVPGQGLTDASYGTQIHESRVLRFEGTLTGRRRRRDNQGWALSVMDRVIEVCRDFTAAYGGMANLLQDYSQAVFKIKGLANALASDQDQIILKRLQLLDLARSIARAIPLDADSEDFKRETTPTAGLPDLLDRMSARLSFATDIPITLLMGTSAAGMNATGEGDLTNWYNNVRNFQEMDLRHPVSRLIQLIAISQGVKHSKADAFDTPGIGEPSDPNMKRVPVESTDENIDFNWRPLWQPTEQETAQTRLTVAQADQIYFTMGVLDSAEIGVSRFGGEKYSIETTLDTPAHSQSLAPDNEDPSADDNPDETDPSDPESAKASGNKGAGSDVQATALNGAQVAALQAMLAGVQDKTLDPKAAIIAIGLSFPAFDPAKVAEMVNAIEVKEPEPPPVMVPGVHPATGQPTGASPFGPPKPAQSVPGPSAPAVASAQSPPKDDATAGAGSKSKD